MGLDTKVGSFTKSSTTAGFPFTQDITDCGFQPKVVIFWGTYQSADGLAEGQEGVFGFATGSAASENASGAYLTTDNVATTATAKSGAQYCIHRISTSAITVQIRLDSFLSNGFRISYSANTADSLLINYLALGGTDISNAKVGASVLAAGTGNQDITDPGFQPDLIFVLRALASVATGGRSGHAAFNIGAGKSATEEWGNDLAAETGRTTAAANDHWKAQRAMILNSLNASSGAQDSLADVAGFISTGFTLNFTTNAIGGQYIYYLALEGSFEQNVGVFNVSAGLGNQTVTTGAYTPKAVLLTSFGAVAGTSILGSSARSIGAATSSTERRASFHGGTTDVLNTVEVRNNDQTKLLKIYTPAATATSSTLHVALDLTSFNSGNFIVNKTTNSGTLGTIEVCYVTFGPGFGGNDVVKTMGTETISISEAAFTRLAAKTRTRTDTAITVGETRARLAAKMRPLAAQSIALSENVIRIKGKVKSLTTETITGTGGTLARLLTKLRTVSDTTTISETRQRLGSKSRPLSTQSIALSESVQRIKSKIKTLATETITVGAGTIARLSSKIRAISLQTVALTDNRTRLKGSMRSIATQTVALSENIVRAIARQVTRALTTQTVALSESIVRGKASQRIISQTVVLVDAHNRLAAKLRALSVQTILLADSIARLVEAPTGITRVLTQTVVLSDSLNRRLSAQRILSQTVPKAENLARVRGITKLISQTILTSESRSRIKSALRPIAQTLVSSDSITKQMTKIRAITQTVITAENVIAETVGNLVRSMVETITVSDSIVRRTVKLVILDQFVVITEQASHISAKLRTIPAQTITLSDSATNELNVIIKNVIKTFSQLITITDYAKIEVVKKSQRFRKILQPSIKRLISNHPAWLLGTRGMHNDYEEFSP